MKKSTVGLAVFFLIGAILFYFLKMGMSKKVSYPFGKTLSYVVDFDQAVTLQPMGKLSDLSASDKLLMESSAKVDLKWKGRMNLTRVEDANADFSTLVFSLAADPETKLDWEVLRKIDGRIQISPMGEVLKVEYFGDTWIEQSGFVRDVFSTFHMNLDAKAEQIEAHSDFDLVYRLVKSSLTFNNLGLTKEYIGLNKRDKAQVSGSVRIILAKIGLYLESLALDRKVSYQVTTGLTKKEEIKIVLSLSDSLPSALSTIPSIPTVSDNLKGSAVRDFYEKASAARAIEGKTFDEVISSQDDLKGPYDATYAEAEAKIRGWLRLHPEVALKIAEKAKTFSTDDPRFTSFLAVLRDVGSPEAQAALAAIVRSSETEPGKQMYYAAYLGDVQNPTRETVTFLMDLSEKRSLDVNTAQAAALGLGRIVHVLNDNYETDRAGELRDHFLGQLQKQTTEDEKKDILAVLGNTRDPKIWSGIESVFRSDTSEDIKTHVVMAARFLPNPEAHAFLVSEARSSVKERQFAALESLSLSPPDKADAPTYEAILKSSTDHAVLQQTLKNLGALTVDDEEARRVMTWFIENCGQTELCSLAESFRR